MDQSMFAPGVVAFLEESGPVIAGVFAFLVIAAFVAGLVWRAKHRLRRRRSRKPRPPRCIYCGKPGLIDDPEHEECRAYG